MTSRGRRPFPGRGFRPLTPLPHQVSHALPRPPFSTKSSKAGDSHLIDREARGSYTRGLRPTTFPPSALRASPAGLQNQAGRSRSHEWRASPQYLLPGGLRLTPAAIVVSLRPSIPQPRRGRLARDTGPRHAGIPHSSEKCVPVRSALFLPQRGEPLCLASSNGPAKGENGTGGAWEMEQIQGSQTRLEPVTFAVYTMGGGGGRGTGSSPQRRFSGPGVALPRKRHRPLCGAVASSPKTKPLGPSAPPQHDPPMPLSAPQAPSETLNTPRRPPTRPPPCPSAPPNPSETPNTPQRPPNTTTPPTLPLRAPQHDPPQGPSAPLKHCSFPPGPSAPPDPSEPPNTTPPPLRALSAPQPLSAPQHAPPPQGPEHPSNTAFPPEAPQRHPNISEPPPNTTTPQPPPPQPDGPPGP
ncbi:nascent polypeptide-associated complex subunit alpha, muscle-specific form-like [Tachyglossus aculeatus]|uniref:nascent polypeptide-associated complex subunit alpha, muscle-specific form-like n=1 Tax=Tachyglossus aculeatus TaxID=9261 RepID=UPI0018F677ED|nr:nascent polypeptide-associated complex subunit alpha, muscle-specific form-like [Tachyglossus aculeatus]